MKFLGVDVHMRTFTVACINANLDILMLSDINTEDLVQYAIDNQINIIAVDAPYGLNIGLMNNTIYRQKLNRNLKGHYNKKVSEYELSRRGITPFSTPENLNEVTGWKSWMEVGFRLFEGLEKRGYRRVDEDFKHIEKGIIEVFPHACFTTLAGHKLGKKTTDEGLNERVELLEGAGFKNLEEIITGSRHVKSDKLDALVASYTALLTFKGEFTFLGDREEGQIVVPVTKVKEKYTYIKKYEKLSEIKYVKEYEKADSGRYEWDYINVDNIVWLKHFQGVKGDIYNIIDFKNNPDLGVRAKIISYEDDKSVEVIFEPIKNSIYGMKPVKEYKEILKAFWGAHGDKKRYRMWITVLK